MSCDFAKLRVCFMSRLRHTPVSKVSHQVYNLFISNTDQWFCMMTPYLLCVFQTHIMTGVELRRGKLISVGA